MEAHIVTCYDIQAFVDGELAPKEANVVRCYIAENPHAEMRFKELMMQKQLLKRWWRED